MSPVMTFRIALKALARNKMRTALTMLGMIIGVSAVITLVALGRGAQKAIEDQIKAGGTNLVTVTAGNFTANGVRGGVGAASNLSLDDVSAIRDNVSGVEYLTPIVNARLGALWRRAISSSEETSAWRSFRPRERRWRTVSSDSDIASATSQTD